MCGGIVKDVFDDALGIIDTPNPPPVVRSDPVADQAKIDSEAAAAAGKQRTVSTRRRRFSSLLATGGAGDTSNVVTGQPAASAGKATLGQ